MALSKGRLRQYVRDKNGRFATTGGSGVSKVKSDQAIMAQGSAAYPKANRKGEDTLAMHTRADGSLTPQRQALHDAIVREHFKGVTPATGRPIAHVMGGGPASGKSVAQSKMDLKNVMVIDVDHIKTKFPEFHDAVKAGSSTAGSLTHEESSMLAKRIAKEAGKDKYNMLLDGSGDGTVEGMITKVAGYRQGGHEIVAHYVTTDVKTAIARSDARGAATGRYVPHAYLEHLHKEVSKVFPLLAKTGVFDKYSLIDTSGKTPKTIVSGEGIKMTVHDPISYALFKRKAK